ncbi:MAG: cysteine methyltransferase [Methanobacteriales archaeon HGW-Methanobacteriales-1]|nr:MAG: cysteine methyltransferase [Methanobacteriales archaeon HGW-Methanobacteriales-1]
MKNKIKISSGKYKEFYFAVACCDNNLISSSLGRYSKEEALKDLNEFVDEKYPSYIKLDNEEDSKNSPELIKKIGKYYYGENSKNKELKFNEKENFDIKVLKEVSKIPYGEFRTYKEIGDRIGTKGYRAVGNALNKNPLPLFIPCHRVIKSDMSIGGFRGGLEMKKELLKREGIQFKGNKVIKNKK